MNELIPIIKVVLDYVNLAFVIYLIGYSTFLFLSVIVGAVTLYRQRVQDRMKNRFEKDCYVPVSLIVPAYNEEVTVVETVKSLLALDYTNYEIIVVNDGSKDDTARVLTEAFDLRTISRPLHRLIDTKPVESVYESDAHKVQLTLINKQNGGKADSLNCGINASRFPYFICMDADSVLQYDSLKKITRPILEDENVIAVGGAVRPCNDMIIREGRVEKYRLPKNILACMQTLEYDRSFLAARILFDRMDATMIISGAFGLFKKETVVQVGGYKPSTMGEDMELIANLHEYCLFCHRTYRIRYVTDAVCWTQVPERLKNLCKQRRRWHIGLRQVLRSHQGLMAKAAGGPGTFLAYVYYWLYELVSPAIELFGIATMVLAYLIDQLNVPFMLLFFVLYAGFGAVMSLTAFFARVQTSDLKLRFADAVKALLLCFFEITFLRFVLATVRMRALFAKRGTLTWNKFERKKMNVE